MNKKIKISIVIGAIIVLFIIISGIILLQGNNKIRGYMSLPPFSLDDSRAQYRVEKNSGSYYLLAYIKNNKRKEIYVSRDTTLNLENYLDRPVKVNGKFIKEKEIAMCSKAPCPSREVVVVQINGIAFSNDAGQIKNPLGEIK